MESSLKLPVKEVVNLAALFFFNLFISHLDRLDIFFLDLLSHSNPLAFDWYLLLEDFVRELGEVH